MSNFNFKAKNKDTGEVFDVIALDDYFGKHKYGYRVDSVVLDKERFEEVFEELNNK